MREDLHDAAVRLSKGVAYSGAGTLEFLVKGDEFYFLEMNTRIQVEHPVTEEVTGLDLVDSFKVAGGENLPLRQSDIKFKGHAIEFRIYTENPAEGFQPALGVLGSIRRPERPWIREEFGFEAGDTISPYYDAMISKLIIRAETREQALHRAYEALLAYEVQGLPTTIPFHRWMLREKSFQSVTHDIGLVDRVFTPECLHTLAASKTPDTQHPATPGLVQQFELAKFGKIQKVEVLHEEGGTFLFRHPATSFKVRSNSYKEGLQALLTRLES